MKYYTTVQVSKLCNVYQTTVINWIKDDKLKAFKTPGGHRRIRENDLKSFLREYNFPIDDNKLNVKWKIMVVDNEKEIIQLIKRLFHDNNLISLMDETNPVNSLITIGKEIPDVIIFDISMSEIDGINYINTLKNNELTENIILISISGKYTEQIYNAARNAGVDLFFAKPLDLPKLKKTITEVLNI